MGHPTVEHLLEMIDQLPEKDRLALEMRLAQRLETEWHEAVAENGRVAREGGITEEAIDLAIHRRRYGE